MTISGFTMVKNATKLYYPIKQSIQSILSIVDEFVVAIGDCDEDDRTLEEVQSIGSDKIKIIRTIWDLTKYPRGMENAHQTDIAKEACIGDWLFYLQADEVVHEKYLPVIKARCEQLLKNKKVEGLLFYYKHFWGDYNHYHVAHGWYPKEIRIIRNDRHIHSWISAQSFRRMPAFDGLNYRQHKNTYPLKVAMVDAYIYHYGWVRPPAYMQKKTKALDTIHHGIAGMEKMHEHALEKTDYGNMSLLPVFKESHPKVMDEWIEKFNWSDALYYHHPVSKNRKKFKHERLKYRILTCIEQNILGGRMLGGFRNYRMLDY
jgi:hypothetical protein